MHCHIRKFFIYSPGWDKKKRTPLDGEAWVVSHVGGVNCCIWRVIFFLFKKVYFFLYKRST